MRLGKTGPAASGQEVTGKAFMAFTELLESWQIMGLGKTGPAASGGEVTGGLSWHSQIFWSPYRSWD